eukprot:453362_1
MLMRSKKAKGDSDLKYGNNNLKNEEAQRKQYKLFGGIGVISFIIILILYSNGNLSLFSSSKQSGYIIGTKTQKAEEATNKILSAWGQQGEALKFANLPSSGQGYLTVTAMVVQDDNTEKKEKIDIFYREASKLNPGGFGIANKLGSLMTMHHLAKMKMPQLANLDKFKGEEEAIKAKEDEIENYVIDKDVTLIFLH